MSNITYSNGFFIENTTFINGKAHVSYPSDAFGYMFLPNQYNFSQNPVIQSTKGISGAVQQNGSTNDFNFIPNFSSVANDTKVIVIYFPSDNIYIVNGTLVLPIPQSQINSIYKVDSSGNEISRIDLLTNTEFIGNKTIFKNLIGQTFSVDVHYGRLSWQNSKVYSQTENVYYPPINLYQFLPYFSNYTDFSNFFITMLSISDFVQKSSIFSPLTPARTPDFFITENNINAFEAFANKTVNPLFKFYENNFNVQNKNDLTNGNETLDGNVKFSFLTNSLKEKTSLMNSSILLKLPVYPNSKDSPVQLSFNLSTLLKLDFWVTWESSGVLKEIGLQFSLIFKTTPSSQEITQSLSNVVSSISTTTVTSKATPGFTIQSIYFLLMIVLIVAYWKRKKHQL